MKKMWWLAALLALPLASAAPGDVLQGVFDKILTVGSLSFIGISGTVPFTRILIWILTFTLFFAVLISLGAGKNEGTFKYLSRRLAMVVAAVLATISAIFLPAAAILAVGTGWATGVGLILIGAPVLGIAYILWSIPGKNEEGEKIPETKGTVLLKLVISMLLFWILSAMNNEIRVVGAVPDATVVGTMANFMAWALYIVSLMIIWYVIKFFLTTSGNKEQRWKEGGQSLGKWLGKKMEAQKEKEQMQRRDNLLKPTRSYLINAIEGSEGLITALFSGIRTQEDRIAAVSKAEKQWDFLKKNLKYAVRDLRRLRRREKGKAYEVFDTLCTHAATALNVAKNIPLPKATDEDWENKRAAVHGLVMEQVRGICGAIVKAIDQFIEQENIELARTAAAQRRERPSRPSAPGSQPRR